MREWHQGAHPRIRASDPHFLASLPNVFAVAADVAVVPPAVAEAVVPDAPDDAVGGEAAPAPHMPRRPGANFPHRLGKFVLLLVHGAVARTVTKKELEAPASVKARAAMQKSRSARARPHTATRAAL